jgi:thiol-disulfide isomerase/thioredoxin
LLPAFLLAVSFGSALAAGTGVPDPCVPAPEIRAALDDLHSASDDRMSRKQAGEARLEAIRSLLEKHPDDLFVHREYQELVRRARRGNLDAIREEYGARLAANPRDVRAKYLHARLLHWSGSPEARKEFEAALRLDPGFPWPHYALVSLLRFGEHRDLRKARSHLRKFLRACPSAPEAYESAGALLEGEELARSASTLRAALLKRADRQALEAYATLWNLEFQAVPPTGHDAVRRRVREDVGRLEELRLSDSKQWHLTLLAGCKIAGDEPGVERARKRFLDRFGSTQDAFRIVSEEWEAGHPRPDWSAPEAEKRAYRRALFAASGEWVRRWPGDLSAWSVRLRTALEMEGLAKNEVARIADGVLEAESRDSESYYFIPPIRHQVASLYLKHKVRVDRVFDLVDTSTRRMEEDSETRLRSGSWSDRMREREEGNLDMIRWNGWHLQMEVCLLRKEHVRARGVIAKMEERLRNLPGREDPGSEPGGVRRAMQVDREIRFWRWRAKLAESEGRVPDAVVYYRNAILAMPSGGQDGYAETREEIETAARKLWKRIGGSAEGWTASLAPVGPGGPEKPPAEVASLGGWKEHRIDLPDFSLTDLKGRTWRLASLKGKVSFVNVWATWCGPCLGELPHLQKLHERLQDRPGVQILTLNVDENPGVVQPYLEKNGFTFPTLLALRYVDRVAPERGIPMNWIVDRSGDVVRQQVGFGSDGEGWIERAVAEIDRAAGR